MLRAVKVPAASCMATRRSWTGRLGCASVSIMGSESPKKSYEKPAMESERAFETLAAGCGLNDPTAMAECDPDFGTTSMGL
jgi:hypothetical protein